ncbi:hypothetical protein CsatB_000232 [Cannabis sativa]
MRGQGTLVGGIGHGDSITSGTCSQVSSNLAPCLDYLRNGGTVPDACCNNIKSLSNAARTPADHQVVCYCLSKVARGSKGFMGYNASGLPGKCGVTSCNR